LKIASHIASDLPSELSTILADALEHSRINKLRRGHCSHSACFPPVRLPAAERWRAFLLGRNLGHYSDFVRTRATSLPIIGARSWRQLSESSRCDAILGWISVWCLSATWTLPYQNGLLRSEPRRWNLMQRSMFGMQLGLHSQALSGEARRCLVRSAAGLCVVVTPPALFAQAGNLCRESKFGWQLGLQPRAKWSQSKTRHC
jgi:hypothetical protein